GKNQPSLRVLTNRNVRIDADTRVSHSQILRIQSEIFNFSDAYPVIQHGTAPRQAPHRLVKDNQIMLHLTTLMCLRKPERETNGGNGRQQCEKAYQYVMRPWFH